MPQKASMMRCPKCGDEQKQSDICAECGIVVEKYLKIKQNSPYDPAATGGVSCMNDVEDEASVFSFNMIVGLGVLAIIIALGFYLI
jgi:predicted nucleic-acid-binding Zn-ribbon protein